MPRMTKTERLALDRLKRNLRALDDGTAMDWAIREHCPDAWRTLEQDVDVAERKIHVTLRLDESVARFYRAMGPGYQARINRILATYAQARIARVAELERQVEEWERTGELP